MVSIEAGRTEPGLDAGYDHQDQMVAETMAGEGGPVFVAQFKGVLVDRPLSEFTRPERGLLGRRRGSVDWRSVFEARRAELNALDTQE